MNSGGNVSSATIRCLLRHGKADTKCPTVDPESRLASPADKSPKRLVVILPIRLRVGTLESARLRNHLLMLETRRAY